MVMVTSASPIGGRFCVPLKMQSAMRSARRDLWLCSPSTQEIASTTLDLPHPLGPTMHVVPEPLNVTTVRSQNDLKPTISTFRSLSKVSSLGPYLRLKLQRLTANSKAVLRLRFEKRDERRVLVPGEEGWCSDKNVGWFSMRALAAWRWRVDGGTE